MATLTETVVTPDYRVMDETEKESDHDAQVDTSTHDGQVSPSKVESTDEAPPAQVRKYKGFPWLAVCAAVYTSSFLYGLDGTIVADIQPFAVKTFGHVQQLGWLGIGFPLGSVATILTFSKAYGVFDVKWLYIGSLTMFEAGSALCGGSPSMNALIIGRVWAGAGGAGMYLGCLNILTLSTTESERPLYMSLTGFFWGAGSILGPVIGGAFADSPATWRWAFYINLVIFAVTVPAVIFILDSIEPQPGKPFKGRFLSMDWAGVVLNAAVYVLLCMPLTLGGTIWSWTDHRMIVFYVMFFVALGLFITQQSFAIFTTKENRIFPVDFLRNRGMILLYITMACTSTSLFVPIYYIPLFFSFVYNYSGIQSAVALLPFICITVFIIMANGFLMPKFGYYKPWYLVSSIFLLIGGALFYSLVDVNTSKSTIYGFSVLIALGTGGTATAGYSVAPTQVDMHRIPDAVGFLNSAQIGASAISLTITSAIFQNIGYLDVSSALAGLNFSSSEIHATLAGAQSSLLESVSPAVRAKALDGIVIALVDVFSLVIVAGALGLICSLLMKMEKVFMQAGAGGA